jgi:calcineurin-like phosphoesterase family protein
MTIFFTSDQHFFHKAIIGYSNRPFKDVEEMNYEIVKRYNEVVGIDDVVYHLGDFSLNDKFVQPILSRLNGIKHLVSGNHDSCFSKHSKHKKSILKYIEYGFASVQERMELSIGDRKFLLCHLPFLKEGDKDQRYPDYRPKNDGQWLLHGHIHEKWLFRNRMINVGVDRWNYYPVSESKILDLVAEISEGEQL